MAANAAEAREMLEASRAHPGLVTQIVPSPLTFKVDNLLTQKIAEGYIGDVLAVSLQSLTPGFADIGGPMHWRNDRDLSGYNILNMGIWYEAMIRWVGPATRVMANTKVNVRQRRDEDGSMAPVTIPRPRGHPGRPGQRGAGQYAVQRGDRLRPRQRGLDLRERGHPASGLRPQRLRRAARRQRHVRNPQPVRRARPTGAWRRSSATPSAGRSASPAPPSTWAFTTWSSPRP